MKKILQTSLLFLCVCTTPVFALLVANPPQALQLNGSKVCDNLSRTFSVPDTLQGYYTYQTVVEKVDSNKILYIKYYLNIGGMQVVKSIHTDLSNYFNEIATPNYNYTIVEQLYLGKSLIFTNNFTSQIFGECYKSKTSCDSVTFTRYFWALNCPFVDYASAQYNTAKVSNDTIHVVFTDSIFGTKQMCPAVVFVPRIIAEDIKIKLEKGTFFVKYQTNSNTIFSLYPINIIEAPARIIAPPIALLPANTKLIIINHCENGTFAISGSQLCHDLKLTWNLSDALKSGYSINTTIEKDAAKQILKVNYTLTPSLALLVFKNVETDLNAYFATYDSINILRNWKIEPKIILPSNIIQENQVEFYPYNDCIEIKPNCDSIQFTHKSISPVFTCFDNNTNTGKSPFRYINVENNKIFLNFNRLAIVYSGSCYYTGSFYIDMKDQSLKNLGHLNYEVYTQKCSLLNIICTTDIPVSGCITQCLSPINTYLGNADLTACLTSGISHEGLSKLYICPNPSTGNITIEGVSGQITVVNQLGVAQTFMGNENFDLSQLSKGIYIIHFQKEGRFITEKISIE